MYVDNGISGLGKFSLKKLIKKHPLTKAVAKLPAPLKAPVALLAPLPVREEILKPQELIPPLPVKKPTTTIMPVTMPEPIPEPSPAPVSAPVQTVYAPPSVYDTGTSPAAPRFDTGYSYAEETTPEPQYVPAIEPISPANSRYADEQVTEEKPPEAKGNWLLPVGLISLLALFG